MTIQEINQFLDNPIPGERIFNFAPPLSETSKKAITSAVLAFNMNYNQSNLACYYQITQVKTTLGDRLKNGDSTTWLKLALFIGVTALSIFSGYSLVHHLKGVYKNTLIPTIVLGMGAITCLKSSWKFVNKSPMHSTCVKVTIDTK